MFCIRKSHVANLLPALVLINVLSFGSLSFAADYTPTASQRNAQKIMGQHYLGPDDVMQHLKAQYTPAQLKKLEVVPFTEELLKACAMSHMLVAGYPFTVKALQVQCKKDSFFIEFDSPTLPEGNWYDWEACVQNDMVRVEWLLVPIRIMRSTEEQGYLEEALQKDCTVCAPRACEIVYASTLAYLARGIVLFEKQMVRCQNKDSQGYDIYVGSKLVKVFGDTCQVLLGSVWEPREYEAKRTIVRK